MTQVKAEIHDNIITILNKLKNINDSGIELELPEGSVIFENILNLKLIQKQIEDLGKTLHFSTKDKVGLNLISNLDDSSPIQHKTDAEQPRHAILSKITLPKISLKIPKFTGLLVVSLVILAIGIFGTRLLSEIPKAEINVVVNSQPLTKSIEVTVKNGVPTDKDKKILAGSPIEITVNETKKMEATGEKIVGEKAKGKISIYNKTDKEKKFDSGTKLKYEDNEYITKDDVIVPARTYIPTDPLDPESGGTYINGSSQVEVEAEKIGEEYDLDKEKGLEMKDYSTNDFSAKVTEKIEGGKTETIKIVSQNDVDLIKEEVTKTLTETSLETLAKQTSKEDKLIVGSEYTNVVEDKFDFNVGDETKELSLTQTIKTIGLTYNTESLDEMMENLVENFIPEGFVLSNKERVLSVEILGNAGTTVLSSNEADIQVTLKTFVVPDINEDTLKGKLVGKKISEAQRILGSIRNVKSYELNLSPRIPLFDKIPKDEDRISITIERE